MLVTVNHAYMYMNDATSMRVAIETVAMRQQAESFAQVYSKIPGLWIIIDLKNRS
jgi:hypothetical protein